MSAEFSPSRRLWSRTSVRLALAAILCAASLTAGFFAVTTAGAASAPAAAAASQPVVLHFQGNVNDSGGDPPTPCTGNGAADIINCDGPFLSTNSALDGGPAAQWVITSPALNGTGGRTIYDPNWIWNSGPVRLGGNMKVDWWASCTACGAGLTADWMIRLWADGVKVFEQRIKATPSMPNVTEKLSTTLFLPELTANNNIVLHVDPVFIDTQNATRIYYDSQLPCPGATGTQPCDSKVSMPVLAPGEPAPTPAPTPTPDPNATPDRDAARFQTFHSPAGTANSFGEPSIGANWLTGNIMFYGGFAADAVRVGFDDCASPAKTTWTKTPLKLAATTRPLGDPILWTDKDTGRTLVSQLLGGTKQSTTDYTDDDGATYNPTVGSGINSGVDHQTLGGGPFAPNPPPHTYRNAVYYCAQDVADANCALSLDGGITFGPAIPIYNITQCGGLHGHIKVAPDGTAYVPNKGCGTQQGLAVSEDNGFTWSVRHVPGTTRSSEDPSIGIATDGTLYFGFTDGNGRAKAAVSRDKGQTWTNITDIGLPFGVKHSVFPVAVAGDPDRAAVGFIGTATDGDPNNMNTFRGVWHLYIATTYDGGKTWTTVNATPGDPVQIGSICRAGTTCGADRNLLDFNDATIDREGRVLIGYADGCLAPACTTATASGNPPYTASRSSKGVITRQSGGKRMFAAFDPPAGPTAPANPRVDSVNRNAFGAVEVRWSEPDNGGSAVTGYNVYRRTASGTYGAPLNSAPIAETAFDDATAAAETAYFYKVTAVNSVGESGSCGEFAPVTGGGVNVCELPGAPVVDDTAANADGGQNTPPDPRVDIKKVFVAEPYFTDSSSRLVFTLQTAPSTQTSAPPSSEWYIIWNRKTIAADKSDRMYVAMKTDAAGAISYEYGNFGPALPLDGSAPPANANTPTRLGAADAGTYDPVKGVITITLSTSKAENIQPGQSVTGINSRTFFARPPGGPRSQNISSDVTTDGSYQLRGNLACKPNEAPVAILAASPTSGETPLRVSFDASGSTDPDAGDEIVEYTFNFGDGSAPVSQSSPLASHTYTEAGDFFARLTVKDSRGMMSVNNAQVVISTTDPSVPMNFALASNGGAASASSTFTSKNYNPSSTIDGSRSGVNWKHGGGWMDKTRDAWPDWLQVDFAGARRINEVRVYTVQNDSKHPVEPTAEMLATEYGLIDFDVQYWDGSQWTTLPGGAIRGNDRVMRVVSFPEITTARIRVLVHNARDRHSRIVEVEAIGPSRQ